MRHQRPGRLKYLEQFSKELIKDYNDGVAAKKLGKRYDVDGKTIALFLDQHNIKRRKFDPSLFEYDEKFFIKDTPEKYYFFGFMLGDGCLSTNGTNKYFTITLNKDDKCILLQFCKWLNFKKKNIKTYTNKLGTYVRLNLAGNFIHDGDFSKYGLVKNKTYDAVIPDIPKKYIAPFLLGLIDADGTVAWKKKEKNICARKGWQYNHYIYLCGNKLLMDWAIDQLRSMGFKGNINAKLKAGASKEKSKKDFIFECFRIQRKQDILDLANLLNIKKFFPILLKRKWKSLYTEITFKKE